MELLPAKPFHMVKRVNFLWGKVLFYLFPGLRERRFRSPPLPRAYA